MDRNTADATLVAPRGYVEDHQTVPVQVWVEVDIGIADMVRDLQTIPGVRTYASCQGYPNAKFNNMPRVMAYWPEFPEPSAEIEARYEVGERGANWAYLHPKGTLHDE